MNIENDTNVSTFTGQVMRINAVKNPGHVLELDVIIRKQIASGLKHTKVRVVFFADHAVAIVSAGLTLKDRVSITGQLDEVVFYKDDEVNRELRISGSHLKVIESENIRVLSDVQNASDSLNKAFQAHNKGAPLASQIQLLVEGAQSVDDALSKLQGRQS